jgi:light-regulated signal transduction histidine kinase (bacteriophytochrome)
VSAEFKDGAWEFAVADNGIGIDGQYFQHVFRLFQRLHTRAAYPGTGIGLALCKKIVERHGGNIWVESTVGQGSTFHFTIPEREEVSDERVEGKSDRDPAGGGQPG